MGGEEREKEEGENRIATKTIMTIINQIRRVKESHVRRMDTHPSDTQHPCVVVECADWVYWLTEIAGVLTA